MYFHPIELFGSWLYTLHIHSFYLHHLDSNSLYSLSVSQHIELVTGRNIICSFAHLLSRYFVSTLLLINSLWAVSMRGRRRGIFKLLGRNDRFEYFQQALSICSLTLSTVHVYTIISVAPVILEQLQSSLNPGGRWTCSLRTWWSASCRCWSSSKSKDALFIRVQVEICFICFQWVSALQI